MTWDDWRDALAPVGGAYADEEAIRLYELAEQTPWDQWIVEVGSYRGFSGMTLAAGSLARPVPRLALVDVWGMEPFRIEDRHPLVGMVENIGELLRHADAVGLMERLFLLRMQSVHAATVWPVGAKIGLLHIDAEHTYDALMQDVTSWQKHLVPGATVAIHDYWPEPYPGVVQAVDELRTQPEWTDWSLIRTQVTMRWTP
jgi:hypothetical protein